MNNLQQYCILTFDFIFDSFAFIPFFVYVNIHIYFMFMPSRFISLLFNFDIALLLTTIEIDLFEIV